jgi:polyhydroxyalkanoate synthesis repressor PhaR
MIVLKYQNRKLYNRDDHRYVTLAELAEAVRQGKDFTVNEYVTGKDITSQILAQVIFEEVSKSSHLGVELLEEIIRTGTIPEQLKRAEEAEEAEELGLGYMQGRGAS